MFKNEKGITLLTLIITIIILIILSTVIVLNINDNEIIVTSNSIVDKYYNKVNDERNTVGTLDDYIDKYMNNSPDVDNDNKDNNNNNNNNDTIVIEPNTDPNIDPDSQYVVTRILDNDGNVPAYASYPSSVSSRAIQALKAYDGKIFLGLGDWNYNTGPVKMVYYDTVDKQIKSSGTINDEAVEDFTIINNQLYTTGCDPRDAWGYGSYYVYNKEENNWTQHKKNNGWIHVFDIEQYHNKIYICGSTVDTSEMSTIQVSSDNGETFESVPVYQNNTLLPYDGALRCYTLIVVNNKLYGFISLSGTYNSEYNGIYEYNETNNRFDYISKLANTTTPTHGSTKYEVFNNNFLYITGSIYCSDDLKNYNRINTNSTGESFVDGVVSGNTLYTLSYSYNKETSMYITRIKSTQDLITFNMVCEFQTTILPFSLEYYNNSFYVGTVHPPILTDAGISKYYKTDNGSLYRIDPK